MTRSLSILGLGLAACVLWTASVANATPVIFGCMTNHDVGNCAAGELQLSVEVTDLGGSQVLFEFLNSGPADSTVTDVYFDDGTLLGIAGLIDEDDAALGSFGDSNVDFSQGAAPPELPGATRWDS